MDRQKKMQLIQELMQHLDEGEAGEFEASLKPTSAEAAVAMPVEGDDTSAQGSDLEAEEEPSLREQMNAEPLAGAMPEEDEDLEALMAEYGRMGG